MDRRAQGVTDGFRFGFVAVIGRPNVGKSTLINTLLGQKIAAVSPRPQTTRRRQLGILTGERAQLIFIDTPGFHEPRHKLGLFMNAEVEASLEAADAILFLVDITAGPTADDLQIAHLIRGLKPRPPVVLAANKLDLVSEGIAAENLASYRRLLPVDSEAVLISAVRRDGLDLLIDLLVSSCPPGAPQYDQDQITDLFEREIAADLIREVALVKLRDEVPHGLGVRIEEFKERENGLDYIRATLLVERESQKGIVIGQGGKMLKQLGTDARAQIEELTGRRAFLELRVKVEKGWRNRESALEQLGYKPKR